MGVALVMKLCEDVLDVGIDPRFRILVPRLCTTSDNLRKGVIEGDDESLLPDAFGQ